MGEIFGNYELVRKIATGGMAEVFLAKRVGELGGFSKRVAIKRMFPHMADDDEARNMFLDEAKIAAQLSHPNIVQVYELGQQDEHLYIVMEYVHGRDLRTVLDTSKDIGSLPVHMSVGIVSQAAAGLHHAHFQTDESGEPMRVVHRDVSPQNVLVAIDGHVKVCDFGIARAEDRIHHTKQGQYKGKISYMSPEQFETSELDHRADIYGLGVLLYEATTGHRLYEADTDLEMLRLLSIGDFKAPSVLSPGFPRDLEAIILKAIARDPNDRFQTAQEFQLELEGWMETNASRVSPIQIGRFMQTLFPELADPKTVTAEQEKVHSARTVTHDQKTLRSSPDSFESSMLEEARTPAPPQWDEPDETLIVEMPKEAPAAETKEIPQFDPPMDDQAQTAEMDAFSREAIRQELERAQPKPVETPKPVEKKVELPKPSFAAGPPAAALPKPSFRQAPEPVAPAPAPAPAPTPASAPAPAAPAPTAGPPASMHPPVASGSRPQGPPVTQPKPAAAKPAARSDFSDDIPVQWKPEKQKGPILIALGVLLLVLAGFGIFWVSLNSESQLTKDAEATRIDPELLEEEPIPVPEMVSVALESNPPGATWVVNGLLAEARGTEVQIRKGVENHVTALLAGHEPTHLRVQGTASSTPRVVELVPANTTKKASLAIVTEPPEAVVYINGEERGRTPATIQDLDAGVEYHVELTREGRFGYAGFVELVADSENLIKADLPATDSAAKRFVEVVFGAIPRGLNVAVNGEPTGQTPFRKNFPRGEVISITFDGPDHARSERIAQLDHMGTIEFRHWLDEQAREEGTISVEVSPSGGTLYVGPNAHGEGVSKLKLKEGSYPVVVEHLGQRLRATVDVLPNVHTQYVLTVSGDTLQVSTK